MKQYEEVFFSVVRAALWKTPVVVPEGFDDWSKVLKLAKAQTLTGLVADVLLGNAEIRAQLPEQAVAKLQGAVRNNMLMHNLLNNTLILVVSKLRENGVESVLLKGQGIARNYPVPELRQCGDIDLYVGEENYEKAYDILEPIASELEDKSVLIIGKNFPFKLGVVTIEVHRYACTDAYPKKNLILQRYAADGLTRDLRTFDFAGTPVNTAADNFNAFYIFYHLWHHFMAGGVGLRQLCDWMMFLHARKETISVEYLNGIVTEMGVKQAWQKLGCLLVDYLGMPAEKFPLYDAAAGKKVGRVVKHILSEGNFGFEGAAGRKRTNHYFYEKWLSLKCYLTRYTSLCFIFPTLTIRELWHVLTNGFSAVFHDIRHKKTK
ncbi:MAG: nucleotidyltransferase family protein [Bacteroidales bacterium]|nr:nucleotidyltransferase family protein [Bacteroidales bacterium]